MPYILDKKNKCIYKKNPDGSRGKRVGCTDKSLLKYLKALQTNVKENNMKETLTQMVRRIIKEEMKRPIVEGKLMFVKDKNIPSVVKEYGLSFDEIKEYEQSLINKSVPELRKLQSVVSQQQDKLRTIAKLTPQQQIAQKQLEFRESMLMAAIDYVAFEKPKKK